jgi:hypothetical protein
MHEILGRLLCNYLHLLLGESRWSSLCLSLVWVMKVLLLPEWYVYVYDMLIFFHVNFKLLLWSSWQCIKHDLCHMDVIISLSSQDSVWCTQWNFPLKDHCWQRRSFQHAVDLECIISSCMFWLQRVASRLKHLSWRYSNCQELESIQGVVLSVLL